MNENVENNNSVTEDNENETVALTEAVATEDIRSETEKKEKKRRHQKKDKFDVKKDIWYRGPLSYRHLKILGWLCIVLTQVAIVEGLKFKANGTANEFFLNSEVMSFITPSALPLLLISVFAVLLSKRDNYKNALIIYGSLSLALTGLFVLIYERYILGIAGSLLGGDRSDLAHRWDEFLYSTGDYKGFIAFNIFIDVFLCTLVMFFLDYEPKRFFKGKKIHIFRAFVFFPLAYEVVCIVMKVMATDHLISLPMWISPFLTTKPPVSILMFLSIVRYIKLREKRFFDTGRTREQYEAYLKTNANSFQFSKHLILIIAIYSLLDVILCIIFATLHLVIMGVTSEIVSMDNGAIAEALAAVQEWGFGGTARMIDLLPIVLLFSYTRSHKMPLIDTAIPIAGVVAIVIVYLDGFFQIIQGSIDKLINVVQETMPF